MCFMGRGTHITREMCFPGRGTHSLGIPGEHILVRICVFRVGEHMSLDR